MTNSKHDKATDSIVLFGIPNCDTVKKARTWLEEEQIEFQFHNFKKDGLTKTQIETWLNQVGLDKLINRKGTSWRALNDEQKSAADDIESAIELMITNPSLIKRPVLQIMSNADDLKHASVGFSDAQFQSIFASNK